MTELSDNFRPTRFGSIIAALLCVMAFLSVIAYGAVDAWAIGLLTCGSLVVLLLWLAEGWRLHSFNYNAGAIQLTIVGMALLGLLQLLPLGGSAVADVPPNASHTLTLDQQSTKLAVIKLVNYLVFFAAALAYISTRKRLVRVVYAVILFGVLIAGFAILQKISGAENIYGTRVAVQASIFGPYINGHHFAALMEMTAGLSLALVAGKALRLELRILLLAAAVVMGAAIVMTGSRGGVLSFLAVLGFVLIFGVFGGKDRNDKKRSFRSWMPVVGGGLAVLLLMLGTGLMLGGDTALRGIGLGTTGADAGNGRLHFWGVALQIFRDNFVIGAGLESFGVAFTKYDTWNGAFRIENAHNDYLQTLADSGIIGFGLIAVFIFLLFKNGYKNIAGPPGSFRRGAALGALAGCFGVLIHSFFDFPLRTPANMLIFLLLSALALVSVGGESPRPARK